jgi:hypothetical protein
MGNNGKEYSLTYAEEWALTSLIGQLTGRTASFDNAPDYACKEWAALLRDNVGKTKMLTIRGQRFMVAQGADIKKLFSRGL